MEKMLMVRNKEHWRTAYLEGHLDNSDQNQTEKKYVFFLFNNCLRGKIKRK